MRQAIESAVQILRANPGSPNEEILTRFINGGIERPAAAQLIALLPLAYGRESVSGSGASFSDTFIYEIDLGRVRREIRLDDLPWWRESVAFARHESASGVAGQAMFTIASRSVEMRAINAAMQDGRKLGQLVCQPPVIIWPDAASAEDSERAAEKPGRWPRIWRSFERLLPPDYPPAAKVFAAVAVSAAVLVGLLAIGALAWYAIPLLWTTR